MYDSPRHLRRKKEVFEKKTKQEAMTKINRRPARSPFFNTKRQLNIIRLRRLASGGGSAWISIKTGAIFKHLSLFEREVIIIPERGNF